MSFSLIACIGKNHELGIDGQLIYSLKNDLKFFRETTLGHKVLMGRKTWESLPGKLENRENIVASHQAVEGADKVINNLDEFIQANKDTDEEIFVIGGGTLYSALLPYAKSIYLTEVDSTTENADTFFPSLNRDNYTEELITEGEEAGYKYSISKFTKS